MATKGERQALLFLAGVALLGAAARACRGREVPVAATELDRQISAVESPVSRGRSRKTGRGRGFAKRDSVPPDTSRRSEPAALAPVSPPARSIQRMDIDVATSVEIEGLPGVGPALAKRIVANRDSAGAFGCLAALDAVRGIGPALL